MKELTREECEKIYGCGINIIPALRGLGEFGEDFAHGAEGGVELGDSLGLFEPAEQPTSKYTTAPVLLKMDVNVANSYMNEMQTHPSDSTLTDAQREEGINLLQNDGRVFLTL